MVKIFVDDVLPLARFPGSGMVLKGGNLVWDAEQAGKDVGVEPDVITARLLVSIANSIENEYDIQMTYDTPSQNSSKMMPVLDL